MVSPAPWAGAASSSTYCASRSPESGAWEGRAARGHGSRRLVAPGVMSGAGSGLRTRPLPQTPPPRSGPKPGSREGSLRQARGPLRWQAGLGRCPWAGSWARKQGIPQRGPSPAPGWTRTKGDLFFLGMPAPSQTYLEPHSGESYTHTWLHKPAGVGNRGPSPAPDVGVKNFAPATPCHRLNIIHLTPS